jgi:hypothetical protein
MPESEPIARRQRDEQRDGEERFWGLLSFVWMLFDLAGSGCAINRTVGAMQLASKLVVEILSS